MLEIINNLKYFFEDCYRRISIREYSRLSKKSPPTSSKLLKKYHKLGLLKKEESFNHIFFYADKQSKEFVDLSRIYWNHKLKPFVNLIEKEFIESTIILFGSLAKAECKKESDIDITIISQKKETDLKKFKHNLKRPIQIFWFKSINEIKNKELKNNILNGYKLKGEIKI